MWKTYYANPHHHSAIMWWLQYCYFTTDNKYMYECIFKKNIFYYYRSLTPNPKLNEIVAAVRNLQGAVQEDTGIPTGY